VDGNPKVADVWLDDDNDNVKKPDGSEWHTVLLMNLRQGGNGVFQLDITDTQNPRSISNGSGSYPPYWSTCGQSWSEPAIGKVKVKIGGTIVDRWVAFFGDGDTSSFPVSSTLCGKQFYVVDLKTGSYLWYLNAFSGGETGFMRYDLASSPLAVDLDGDGYIDRVYIGDRGGQMWRLDVSAVGTHGGGNVNPAAGVWVDNWGVSRLFASATTTQMFYARPAASFDDRGTLWVFAGTGDRAHPTSLNDPADAVSGKGVNGRLYGIKDTYVAGGTVPAPWTDTNLQDVSNNNFLDPQLLSRPGGWMVKLDQAEKLFNPVEIFNKVVFFSTVKPGATISGNGCTSSPASARLYQLYYATGGGVTDVAAFRATTPTASARYVTLGSGAPVRTIISTLALGGGAVLLTGTNEQALFFGTGNGTRDLGFAAPDNMRFTNYWRQN
jgi:type IV pilus assembly protein PilY1